MNRAIFLPLVYALTLQSAQAAIEAKTPPKDCSQKFLANWLWNREAAIKMLPTQPCVMYGETGQFICDRSGCNRRER